MIAFTDQLLEKLQAALNLPDGSPEDAAQAALDALLSRSESAAALETENAGLMQKLAAAEEAKGASAEDNARRDQYVAELQGQLQVAQTRLAELDRQNAEAKKAALDAELAGYEMSGETAETIREIMLADGGKARRILAGIPKKAAPDAAPDPSKEAAPAADKKPVEDRPPEPQHDPARMTSGPGAEERAAKIAARARELQAKDPKLPWADAYGKAQAETDKELAGA